MKRLLLMLVVLLWALLVNAQCIIVNNASFTNPSGDNVTWSLTVNWTAQGTKHLNIVVLNAGDTAFATCFQINATTTTTGTVIYDNIITPGGCAGLSAVFTRHNGLCGTDDLCGPNQAIWNGGPLNVKFTWIQAENLSNCTRVRFKVESHEGKRDLAFNFTMSNGSKKSYNVRLPIGIKPGDVWEVTVNNINGSYTTKKLN